MMNSEAHVDHTGRWISVVHKIFIGKTERKRPFGRPKCRWECNIKTWVGSVWKGFIRIRTGVSRGLSSTQYKACTFGFHNIREISWTAEQLIAFLEGLCF